MKERRAVAGYCDCCTALLGTQRLEGSWHQDGAVLAGDLDGDPARHRREVGVRHLLRGWLTPMAGIARRERLCFIAVGWYHTTPKFSELRRTGARVGCRRRLATATSRLDDRNEGENRQQKVTKRPEMATQQRQKAAERLDSGGDQAGGKRRSSSARISAVDNPGLSTAI